ncbi:MAG: putative metalloprotease CJM1_0395 family protein [Wolinella sp.]
MNISGAYGAHVRIMAPFNGAKGVDTYDSSLKNRVSKDEKDNSNQKGQDGESLSQSEMAQVRELSRIDSQVKAHENAHIAAGAGVVSGGASYSYTRGPDGKMYATAGEVPIDTSMGDDPKENIAKARQIRAAALAPSDPSPQDYKVAATASMLEMKAQIELSKELSNSTKESRAQAFKHGIQAYKK